LGIVLLSLSQIMQKLLNSENYINPMSVGVILIVKLV
jgi:hypothetical protein